MIQTSTVTTTNDLIDQADVINTPIKSPGTFGVTAMRTTSNGVGPLFTQINNSIVGNDVKPIDTEYKLLENFDIRRLVSILTQEAIKISNLDADHITEKDRIKVLQALYALNPKKYPFIASNDEKFASQDIITPDKKAEKRKSPPFFLVPKTEKNPLDKIISETTPTKNTLRPSYNLGKPKLTIVGRNEEIKKELEEVKKVKPVDLFDTLHKKPEAESTHVEPIVEIETPTPEIMKVAEITTHENVNEEEQKEIRLKAVGNLYKSLSKYRGENWMNWAVAISLGIADQTNPHETQIYPQNLPGMEKLNSWRDSPKIAEIRDFLNDLLTP